MQLETLQKDMIAAMKARDKARKDSISSLISAVKKVAIDEGCRDDIKEELVDRVILKELKTAKEQIDTCPAERTDLLAEYQARYDVINEYAPSLMSEDLQTSDSFLCSRLLKTLLPLVLTQDMLTVVRPL